MSFRGSGFRVGVRGSGTRVRDSGFGVFVVRGCGGWGFRGLGFSRFGDVVFKVRGFGYGVQGSDGWVFRVWGYAV